MSATDYEDLMKAPRIRLHFNVSEPVELVEMTLAFQGLGFEYQSFIRQQHEAEGLRKCDDVKLYITKIESNCILAELAPALPMLGALAPVFADVNNVAAFVRNIGEAIDWLKGLADQPVVSTEDVPYSKRKLNNLKDIVRLVSHNKNASLGLSAIKFEESEDRQVLEVHFNDQQCAQAEQGAKRALKALDSTEKADREKVLMYFYQTNTDDPKTFGRTGDKAVIASITEKPLSVYILTDVDQQKIRYVLDDKSHNPLQTGFIVDVNIEHDRKGQPKVYRVMHLHDVVYDED